MSSPILRYAAPHDLCDISAIWQLCFGDGDGFVGRFFEVLQPACTTVVAELDGRVLAFITAFDNVHFCEGKYSYLYALAVHPEHQRRGLGAAVLQHAICAAHQRGHDGAFLRPASAELSESYIRRFFGTAAAYLHESVFIAEKPPGSFSGVSEISLGDYISRVSGGASIPQELASAQALLCESYGEVFLSASSGSCFHIAKDSDGFIVKNVQGSGFELSQLCAFLKTDRLTIKSLSQNSAGALYPAVIFFPARDDFKIPRMHDIPFFWLD